MRSELPYIAYMDPMGMGKLCLDRKEEIVLKIMKANSPNLTVLIVNNADLRRDIPVAHQLHTSCKAFPHRQAPVRCVTTIGGVNKPS
jgi:hypothetical protein